MCDFERRYAHSAGRKPQAKCPQVVQYDVHVLRSGESPSVTEQGGPVCASPGSSGSLFVIIKFPENRFCLSDTSRRSCERPFSLRGRLRRESSRNKCVSSGKRQPGKAIQNNSICQRFPLSHLRWRTLGGEGRSQNKSLLKLNCMKQ